MSSVSTTVASSSLRSQQQHSAAIYGAILVNLQLHVSLYFQSSKKKWPTAVLYFQCFGQSGGGRLWPRFMDQETQWLQIWIKLASHETESR